MQSGLAVDERWAMGHVVGDPLVDASDQTQHGMRNRPARSRNPRQLGQDAGHVPHRHALAAENVVVSDLPGLEGQHVSLGDVVGVDDVEHRVHIGLHPALEKVQDDVSRGRGATVPLAQDGRRVHDH
jgi:hypothetical protein